MPAPKNSKKTEAAEEKAPRAANPDGTKARVLKALSKATNGLTRNQLSEKTGIKKGWAKLLGAATKGAEGGMEGEGLVKSAAQEGARGLLYTITAKGKQELAKIVGK